MGPRDSWPTNPVFTAALALLEEARPIIDKNLLDLTEEEYLWEPTSGCWSIRPRAQIRSPQCWGRGDWVVEVSVDGTVEPTMTTVAWRLMHAYDCATDFASRATGGNGHDWNDIEVAASAAAAVELMTTGLDEVAAMFRAASDSYLGGEPDPFFHRPRWELLMKALHEPIHHCAEIGVLRTLFHSTSG